MDIGHFQILSANFKVAMSPAGVCVDHINLTESKGPVRVKEN
jgi:hypothetical protein